MNLHLFYMGLIEGLKVKGFKTTQLTQAVNQIGKDFVSNLAIESSE